MYGLDLFSGIGGLTKALQVYVHPAAFCENDRYAQGVLLSRMRTGDLPWAPIADEVRELRRVDFGSPIDIIYGGFPCQDISVAGRGAGLDGERSGLFFEIARLVGEIRPRFVFLENVPAITSRGGVRVVAEFACLGYDCRWDMLSAADVGAVHLRERWWLLAHDGSAGKGIAPRTNANSIGSHRAEIDKHGKAQLRDEQDGKLGQMGEVLADANGEGGPEPREARRGRAEPCDSMWWSIEPNVGRVAHGIPFRVDRLRGLGNAVVPAQAREAFERLMGLK